nr:chaperone protein DnaJ [Tanacetum cinerariifolium]
MADNDGTSHRVSCRRRAAFFEKNSSENTGYLMLLRVNYMDGPCDLSKITTIERMLRRETSASENQFGFMPGRSSVEAIHLIRSLMEKYRERQRDLHMAFLDLEKAYDSVPQELIWKTLVDKGSSRRYINVIRDMYDGVKTRARTSIENTEFFLVDVGLHQGSAISPYLFALILDELSKEIQEDIPWCLIFADDIVLVSESAESLNIRLENWREALEDNGLRVSREKTEYLRCDFGNGEIAHNEEVDVCIGDKILQPKETFRYLGSMLHKSGMIDKDGGSSGIKNAKVDLWRRSQSSPVRRVEALVVDGLRKRGRPKLRWEDRVKHDIKELLLSEDMTFDMNEWRARIRPFVLCVVALLLVFLASLVFCLWPLSFFRLGCSALVIILLCTLWDFCSIALCMASRLCRMVSFRVCMLVLALPASVFGKEEKKILNHLKQDQEMLVIKIFSERKKVFREEKKCEKIRAKRRRMSVGAAAAANWNDNEKSPYDTLELEGDANDEEIKFAYRRLAKYYHPDVTNVELGNDFVFVVYDGRGSLAKGETAEARFIKIQAAYELLIDSEERRKYDMENRANPMKASQAWMEWLMKKKKAFDQRGDMAIAAWAEQQQRELNIRVRQLSRSKIDPDEERRILAKEKKASMENYTNTLKRHTLVLKKRDLMRKKAEDEKKKLLITKLLAAEGLELASDEDDAL